MKRRKYIYSLAVAVVLIGLSACQPAATTAGTSKPASTTTVSTAIATSAGSTVPSYMNMSSEFPIVKTGEKVKLTVITAQDDSNGGNAADIWYWKWASKKMNITFEVEQVMQSGLKEKKKLLFASGNLPDILLNMGLTSTELVTYGQNEKQLMPLNTYLNKNFSPTICDWFAAYPEAKAVSTCPDNLLYTLPMINEANNPGSVNRIFINQNWLKAIDMKTPETLDDFITMLRKFKENDPGKVGKARVIPLGGGFNAIDPRYYILDALGYLTKDNIGTTAAIRDGKVVIPASDATFKEFLKIMKSLYDEGLISKDFFTLDATQVRAQAVEGAIGVIAEPAYLSMRNTYKDWWAAKPLTSQWNKQQLWLTNDQYSIGGFAIAKTCKYPEVAMRAADFAYTDLGGIYVWGGPMTGSEDTLGLVGGWYVKDDKSTAYVDVESKKYASNYIHLMKVVAAGWQSIGNRTLFAFADQDKKYEYRQKMAGINNYVLQLSAENPDHHYRMSVKENLMPYAVSGYPGIVYFSQDQSTRISDLSTVITNYVKSETAKFITGARSLNEFDKYMQELKTIGIDEYTKYYVDAYSAYLAKK